MELTSLLKLINLYFKLLSLNLQYAII